MTPAAAAVSATLMGSSLSAMQPLPLILPIPFVVGGGSASAGPSSGSNSRRESMVRSRTTGPLTIVNSNNVPTAVLTGTGMLVVNTASTAGTDQLAPRRSRTPTRQGTCSVRTSTPPGGTITGDRSPTSYNYLRGATMRRSSCRRASMPLQAPQLLTTRSRTASNASSPPKALPVPHTNSYYGTNVLTIPATETTSPPITQLPDVTPASSASTTVASQVPSSSSVPSFSPNALSPPTPTSRHMPASPLSSAATR